MRIVRGFACIAASIVMVLSLCACGSTDSNPNGDRPSASASSTSKTTDDSKSKSGESKAKKTGDSGTSNTDKHDYTLKTQTKCFVQVVKGEDSKYKIYGCNDTEQPLTIWLNQDGRKNRIADGDADGVFKDAVASDIIACYVYYPVEMPDTLDVNSMSSWINEAESAAVKTGRYCNGFN